jgi:hypothetical protein
MSEQHDELAGRLEREAARLEHESDRLEHEIDEVRADWHRKQRDESVPGAEPPDSDQEESDPAPGEMERE